MRQLRRLVVQVPHGDLERIVTGERRAAGQAAVGDRAQGVDVGGTADRPTGGLLGSHVEGGARHRVGAGDAGDVGGAGHAEVHQDDGAVLLHQQVAGLDVAVHDAAAMRRVERCGRLGHDRHRLGHVEPPGRLDPLGQRLAGDELHDEVVRPPAVGEVVRTAVEDLHDAGVPQRRHDPGLGAEPGDEIGIGDQRRQEDLDRDLSAEDQVGGTPNVAHAARGDTFVQAVATAEHDLR
ncbi:hypothetical protein GUI43_06584 [Micromonospora noduli]|nr:hypothetical protein GUI43_06584 [Micromonospora noduli]